MGWYLRILSWHLKIINRLKIRTLWGIKPCRTVNAYRRFQGAYCLHFENPAVSEDCLTLKMEAHRSRSPAVHYSTGLTSHNNLNFTSTSWLHRASNNVETFSLPTDAHNVKKRNVKRSVSLECFNNSVFFNIMCISW